MYRGTEYYALSLRGRRGSSLREGADLVTEALLEGLAEAWTTTAPSGWLLKLHSTSMMFHGISVVFREGASS